VRQTLHFLKDIGEVSCVERPVSKRVQPSLWKIEIRIPDAGISWERSGVYAQELDDIVIDIWAKIFNGNLEDFRAYEFWEN